jgi:hypothetical protein
MNVFARFLWQQQQQREMKKRKKGFLIGSFFYAVAEFVAACFEAYICLAWWAWSTAIASSTYSKNTKWFCSIDE